MGKPCDDLPHRAIAIGIGESDNTDIRSQVDEQEGRITDHAAAMGQAMMAADPFDIDTQRIAAALHAKIAELADPVLATRSP